MQFHVEIPLVGNSLNVLTAISRDPHLQYISMMVVASFGSTSIPLFLMLSYIHSPCFNAPSPVQADNMLAATNLSNLNQLDRRILSNSRNASWKLSLWTYAAIIAFQEAGFFSGINLNSLHASSTNPD
ncbi:hypothetical protein HanPI659440_Chr03g0131151 [Helianthus annuus]|nr:hypothetical protein HanPI659440_Chr03g0131151 [Helianthus annuus]